MNENDISFYLSFEFKPIISRFQNNECPICYKDNIPKTDLVTFNCYHHCCWDCLVCYIHNCHEKQEYPVCFLCRASMSTLDIECKEKQMAINSIGMPYFLFIHEETYYISSIHVFDNDVQRCVIRSIVVYVIAFTIYCCYCVSLETN